jgi:hypothetical protein
VGDDSIMLSDSSDEQTLAPSYNAQKRQKTATTHDVDCDIIETVVKERVLLKKTDELKL